MGDLTGKLKWLKQQNSIWSRRMVIVQRGVAKRRRET
jgi:hypothetical protein